MQTIRNVRRRAKADLRRRIYERGLFRPARLERLAHRLAGAYAAGLSDGDLRALARHDSWLEAGRCGDVGRIEDMLFHYLRRELRRLAQSFWEGRTSVELAVQTSRVKLVGFFNGERPGAQNLGAQSGDGHRDPFAEMPGIDKLSHELRAPYA